MGKLDHRIDTLKLSKFWGVSRRSMQNWVKAGHPVERPMEMAQLILSGVVGNKAALSKAHELLAQREGLLPVPEKGMTGDSIAAAATARILESGLKLDDVDIEDTDLRAVAAWFLAKSKECLNMSPPDLALMAVFHDKYLKTEKAIRDGELHAKKMGLAEGQIITREEFERLLFAIAFWSMRSVDVDLKALGPRLVGLDFVEEAYSVLDRFFVRSRFFSAFAKSITQESGVSLPLWAYDCVKVAVDRFWETDSTDPDDVAAYAAFQADLKRIAEGDAKSA